MKSKLRHFFLLTFSTLVMAAGTYFFKFPNHFTFGGITGLAVAEEKKQQQYEDMKLRIKYMYEEGDTSALERIVASGRNGAVSAILGKDGGAV